MKKTKVHKLILVLKHIYTIMFCPQAFLSDCRIGVLCPQNNGYSFHPAVRCAIMEGQSFSFSLDNAGAFKSVLNVVYQITFCFSPPLKKKRVVVARNQTYNIVHHSTIASFLIYYSSSFQIMMLYSLQLVWLNTRY